MRGGKREGAGRKAKGPDERKVQLVLTIPPEMKERLSIRAIARGQRVSKYTEQLIAKCLYEKE